MRESLGGQTLNIERLDDDIDDDDDDDDVLLELMPQTLRGSHGR
jgi:hypothetical protein